MKIFFTILLSCKLLALSIFEISFDGGLPFSEGVAWVFRDDESFYIPNTDYFKKYALIDKQGKILIPLKYYAVRNFSEGVAAAAIWNSKLQKLQFGIIDKAGRWIVQPKFDRIDEFHNGLARATGNEGKYGYMRGKRGYIDFTGKWIIPPIYTSASDFFEGYAMVELNHKNFYINKFGEKINDPILLSIRKSHVNPVFLMGVDQIRWNYAFGHADKTKFREGVFRIENESGTRKYGYCDFFGKLITPIIYEDAEGFSEGYAAVAKKDPNGSLRWGYIDMDGKVKIDFKFQVIKDEFGYAIPNFSDGLACVYGGYINKSGDFVIQFKPTKNLNK